MCQKALRLAVRQPSPFYHNITRIALAWCGLPHASATGLWQVLWFYLLQSDN